MSRGLTREFGSVFTPLEDMMDLSVLPAIQGDVTGQLQPRQDQRVLANIHEGHQHLPAWRPSCDVREKGDKIEVIAELPGVSPENLKVELVDKNRVLRISGQRSESIDEEKEQGGAKWVLKERSTGSFQRSFRLPEGTKPEDIETCFENGVLCVNFPKLDKHKKVIKDEVLSIPIKTGGKMGSTASVTDQKAQATNSQEGNGNKAAQQTTTV